MIKPITSQGVNPDRSARVDAFRRPVSGTERRRPCCAGCIGICCIGICCIGICCIGICCIGICC
ncbi:MAG TPA: hypothetical protein VFV99_26335, partial [Kofleriaceae bacterium]|nr:hypothetical protein [Kofleriaceae bacterium]